MFRLKKDETQKAISRYVVAGSQAPTLPKWIAALRPLVERRLLAAGLESEVEGAMVFLSELQPAAFDTDSSLYEGRYVPIHSRRLKQLLSNKYKQVLYALSHTEDLEQVIGVYGGELKDAKGNKPGAREGEGRYEAGLRSKAYRIIPRHWPLDPLEELDSEPHAQQVAFKIWCEQDDELRAILLQSARKQLSQMTMRICAGMDLAQAEKDVRASIAAGANLGNAAPLDTFRFVNNLVTQRHYYEHSKDAFGHRYHSPLTNCPRHIREYVRFDGKPGVEVDFKNSQYYLLALCAKYPDAIVYLLQEDGDQAQVVRAVHQLQKLYRNTPDGYAFCEQALAGNLYQWLADLMGTGRDSVKGDLMAVVMSDKSEAKRLKERYQQFIPNVIDVCGELNAPTAEAQATWEAIKTDMEGLFSYKHMRAAKGRNYEKQNAVPMLMQRIEAKIVVDRIAVELQAATSKAFTTIHDSFLTHPDNVPMLMQLIKRWFEGIGIPKVDHPKVKCDQRIGANPLLCGKNDYL